ncbi:hypothetical protein O6161_25295, partial [Salmonella enterica subsp. enterica]
MAEDTTNDTRAGTAPAGTAALRVDGARLWDALMPALYFGKPIVGYQGRFSPEVAFGLMERYRVTNTFLFP